MIDISFQSSIMEYPNAGYSMIQIYTDGCCKHSNGVGPGGWSFIILHKNKVIVCYGYSERTTNNIMELSGLYAALDWVIHHNKHKINIKFYSDSRYVVDGFNSWVESWKRKGWKLKEGKVPKNLEVWKILHEQKSILSSIKGEWVRGHSGNEYNEIADMLANFGYITKVNKLETFTIEEFKKWIQEIKRIAA